MVVVLPLILIQHGVNFVPKVLNIHIRSRADLFTTFLQGETEWSVLSNHMISNKLCRLTAHPPFTSYGDTPCLKPPVLIICKLTHNNNFILSMLPSNYSQLGPRDVEIRFECQGLICWDRYLKTSVLKVGQ